MQTTIPNTSTHQQTKQQIKQQQTNAQRNIIKNNNLPKQQKTQNHKSKQPTN